MIDVLSDWLGDLGCIFVMNCLLSTDAKKNFLFLTESPADLPSGLSPKHSPEVLLPSLTYLSSPIPTTSCLHKKEQEIPVQMFYLKLVFSLFFSSQMVIKLSQKYSTFGKMFLVRFEICAFGSLGRNTARASCLTWRCLHCWWDKGHLWHSCALIMCANCTCTPSQSKLSPT